MKKILAIVLALAILLVPAGSALAAPQLTATVTISMTGGEISISVDPTDWTLGMVVEGGIYASTGDSFTLTNGSTTDLVIDVTIEGANTTDWDLSDTATPDDDVYGLNFDGGDTAGGWVAIPNNDTSAPDSEDFDLGWLATAGADTDGFDLQLLAPDPMTTLGAESAVITFTAVQS